MRCEECEQEFTGLRCECGWKAPSLAVAHPADQWHVRECQNVRVCGAMIRERIGQAGHPLCKWCQAGTAHKPKTEAKGAA